MTYLLFFIVVAGLILNERRLQKMAAKLQELQDAITALIAESAELKTSVDAEIAQSASLIEAVNKLIEAIGAGQDVTPLVTAVSAAIGELQATRATLSGDNTSVQEAIDKANAITTPPNP
jgi:ABC-type transporter Mla subunit MlaD